MKTLYLIALALALVLPAKAADEKREWIAAAISATNEVLKDAESAKYRRIKAYATPEGSKRVCGEVNAKNSYGAYAGFARFVVIGSEVVIEDRSDYETTAVIDVACVNGTEVPVGLEETQYP